MKYLIQILLALIGLSALVSGALLIIDPTGSMLGWNTLMLADSPFPDYLVPGIILFNLMGVLCCIVFVYTLHNKKGYALLLLAEGCILIGWILVQIFIIKSLNALQVFIFITGLIFILYSVYSIRAEK